MNEAAIRKFLQEEYPWYLTDAGLSMLRGAQSIDELRSTTVRLGRDLKLPINAEYEAAVREYFSIYAFEEYHGESSRQKIYAEKKAKDEVAETAKHLEDLVGVRIINELGERRDVTTLTLPELRQAKADIANHKRMKAMNASDLRAEQAAQRPVRHQRADGYPILPQSMVLPAGLRIGDRVSDGIHATPMTPELIYLFSRAKSDSAEWHFYKFRLVRAYGSSQVTQRQQITATTVAGA